MACKSLYGPCDTCDSTCEGCVKVVNPCLTGSPPVPGELVELFEVGGSTVVASGTTDSSGLACGLPGGTYDIRLSLAGKTPILYRDQVIPCGGTLELVHRSGGTVRLYGMTCNSSAGRVATTWTVSRTGYDSQTVTTDTGTGYVEIWLPATGTWNRTTSADKFLTESGTFNFTNACSSQNVFPNFGTGTPVSTHFCGCSAFAASPKPFQKMATVTDGGGSTSIDISASGNWCGGNICVERDLGNATAVPAMPGTFCSDFGTRRSCGTLPYDDAGTRAVKVSFDIFASKTGGLPEGAMRSPQASMTWNRKCVVNPPNPLQACAPADTRSKTWRDGRWNCSHTTAGGTLWFPTSYTIHSHDPPVVELHYDQGEDFAERAGSTPPLEDRRLARLSSQYTLKETECVVMEIARSRKGGASRRSRDGSGPRSSGSRTPTPRSVDS
jgi:hypothetical protein